MIKDVFEFWKVYHFIKLSYVGWIAWDFWHCEKLNLLLVSSLVIIFLDFLLVIIFHTSSKKTDPSLKIILDGKRLIQTDTGKYLYYGIVPVASWNFPSLHSKTMTFKSFSVTLITIIISQFPEKWTRRQKNSWKSFMKCVKYLNNLKIHLAVTTMTFQISKNWK